MKPLDLTDTRPLRSALRRRLASLRKLAPALLLSLAPLLGASQPAVVNADGTCTTSGSQVTCTFSYTGAEQSWQVPAGVSSVQVTAIGGSGSSNVASDGTTVAGGKGAKVSATVPVPAGTTTLYVEVGQPSVQGLDCNLANPACFNSSGGVAGHAGGAASDVRTCSMANCPFFQAGVYGGVNDCIGFYSCDNRLVVAGGGGGAGGAPRRRVARLATAR
jgi:Glycine rich protein